MNTTENPARLLGVSVSELPHRWLICFILRSTIHPIISRLSVDTLVGQMARFREDERFKAVGPDSIVLSLPTSTLPSGKGSGSAEAEIWLDWAFVDFWKSNYCGLL